jgi:hypothetical protein
MSSLFSSPACAWHTVGCTVHMPARHTSCSIIHQNTDSQAALAPPPCKGTNSGYGVMFLQSGMQFLSYMTQNTGHTRMLSCKTRSQHRTANQHTRHAARAPNNTCSSQRLHTLPLFTPPSQPCRAQMACSLLCTAAHLHIRRAWMPSPTQPRTCAAAPQMGVKTCAQCRSLLPRLHSPAATRHVQRCRRR